MGKGKRVREQRHLAEMKSDSTILALVGQVAVFFSTYEVALQLTAVQLEAVGTKLNRRRRVGQQRNANQINMTMANARALAERHPNDPDFVEFLKLADCYGDLKKRRDQYVHAGLFRWEDRSLSLVNIRHSSKQDWSELTGELLLTAIQLTDVVQRAYGLFSVVQERSEATVEELVRREISRRHDAAQSRPFYGVEDKPFEAV